MKTIKQGAVWLLSAACAVLLVLLMLFYRSEAKDAQKLSQELTQELVLAEEALDERMQLEAKQSITLESGRKAKAAGQEKTDASIKVIKRKGSSTPLDSNTIEQLRLRSGQVRASALSAQP